MCFWRRKKKETVTADVPVEEQPLSDLFDGPYFTIDMVPVVPSSLDDIKPVVKPEEFAVYTVKDKSVEQ